jgi:hypothetical protein
VTTCPVGSVLDKKQLGKRKLLAAVQSNAE